MVTGCARTALNWQQSDFFSSIFSAGSWQNGGVGQFEYKWEKAGPAATKRRKGKCGKQGRQEVSWDRVGRDRYRALLGVSSSECKMKEELVKELLGIKKTRTRSRAGNEKHGAKWGEAGRRSVCAGDSLGGLWGEHDPRWWLFFFQLNTLKKKQHHK